jgi:hypothetical protein
MGPSGLKTSRIGGASGDSRSGATGGARVDERDAAAKAKAILFDPETLTAVWMNESAAADLPQGRSILGAQPEDIVPSALAIGVREALWEVADTGETRHLRTALVSTARGALLIVVSIHRLPDDKLLLIMENGFQPVRGPRAENGRPRRRL